MIRVYQGPVKVIINLVCAMALMVSLFSALPGLRSLGRSKTQDTTATLVEKQVTMETKKEEEKQKRTPTQMLRTVAAPTHASTSRDAEGSFKFVPDLGVQGSGDVAIEDRRQVKAQVFNEDETDVRPTLVAQIQVAYPPDAQKEGVEGVVEMEILVDETGRVVRVDFLQLPSELFRTPVINAVMHWRFKPAQVKGVAVSVRVHQKISFSLSQAAN
jgi:TonB family protein